MPKIKPHVGRGPMQAGFGGNMPPFHKVDAIIDQAAPTTGLQYTVLDTVSNARLIAAFVQCTWTVQPDPLQIHLTIDGRTITANRANPVTITTYYLAPDMTSHGADAYNLSATKEDALRRAFLLDGRSIKVTAEITGGTVSNLRARCIYALY